MIFNKNLLTNEHVKSMVIVRLKIYELQNRD